MTTKQHHKNRETWLNRSLAVIDRQLIEPNWGERPSDSVRVSCGWPAHTRGGNKGVIGQCWSDKNSKDKHFEIFISPKLADPIEVLAVLLHERIHSVVGLEEGHKGKFRDLALLCGLEGKMTATTPGAALQTALGKIAEKLGAYPHAVLSTATRKKQTTRMIKASCPECAAEGDSYIIRASRKVFERGVPKCPIHERELDAEL